MQCGGIASPQTRQGQPRREFARIEKIRADAARLQLEFTKLQDIAIQRELNKVLLICQQPIVHTTLLGVGESPNVRLTAPNISQAAVWVRPFAV